MYINSYFKIYSKKKSNQKNKIRKMSETKNV